MNQSELIGGKPFARRYEMQAVLGTGVTATVFRARDIHAEELVAVKVFKTPEDLARLELSPADIEREAEIQAGLDHRNILPFYRYGVASEHQYITMMLACEGSLKQRIERGRLPVESTVGLVIETAAGIQYAHDQELVHRDIKPGNILLHPSPESTVRVADLGIAVQAREPHAFFTLQDEARGTAVYAAPEQIRGRAVKQSDLYSLGVVAFELATGKRPFEADTTDAYMAAHLREAPPTFESILGNDMTTVHEAIEIPIQRALSKKPKNRQGSIGDYAHELETAYEKATGIQRKEITTIDLGHISTESTAQETTEPANMTKLPRALLRKFTLRKRKRSREM